MTQYGRLGKYHVNELRLPCIVLTSEETRIGYNAYKP